MAERRLSERAIRRAPFLFAQFPTLATKPIDSTFPLWYILGMNTNAPADPFAGMSFAESMAAIRQGRRWSRNYTGVWHICAEGSMSCYCGHRLRSARLERKQALTDADTACSRCAKVAPASDSTADLPRKGR